MLELIQPEELNPKGYRKREVAYILAETEKLNSLGILQYEGMGYGLTNLLRYVCFSKDIKRDINYYFLDSNYLLSFPKDKSLKDLEDLVKAGEKACCIVVGQIQSDLIESVFSMLISLRNMYKHKVCFLMEIRLKEGEGVEDLPYPFKQLIANNYFFIEPLNQNDLLLTILRMGKKFDVDLTRPEAKDICISCKGNLLKAKEIITERHVKKIWKEQVSQKTKGTLSLRGGYLCSGKLMIENGFTKNESLLLKLFVKQDALVSRDDIALIIAPDGMSGVTDELIDQSISRLRKKLKKLKLGYTIKTIRGRGYIGESD